MESGLPQAFFCKSQSFLSQSELWRFDIAADLGRKGDKACAETSAALLLFRRACAVPSPGLVGSLAGEDFRACGDSRYIATTKEVARIASAGSSAAPSASCGASSFCNCWSCRAVQGDSPSTSACSTLNDDAYLSPCWSRAEETDTEEEEDEEQKEKEAEEDEEVEEQEDDSDEGKGLVCAQRTGDDLSEAGDDLWKVVSSAAFVVARVHGDDEKVKQEKKVDWGEEEEEQVEGEDAKRKVDEGKEKECHYRCSTDAGSELDGQKSHCDGEEKASDSRKETARVQAGGSLADAALRTGTADAAGVGEAVPPPSGALKSAAPAADPALVAALAHVLSHLASLGQRPQQATPFHGAREPWLSIRDYLVRIATYMQCSNECLVLGLVYIDRIVKLNPEFVISGLSIHRLLLISMTLATKFHNDIPYSNAYCAQVGGLMVEDLNMLEKRFLQLVGWRLHVAHEEYELYRNHVINAARPWEQGDRVHSP